MIKTVNKGKFILLAILVLASFVRFWKLDAVPVSLFGDEIDAGYHAYSISKTARDYQGNFMPIHFHSIAEWRTPLFIYSLVPTVAVFGVTPWGVRIPAAFFGVLGVWGMYLLVNELMGYHRTPFTKHNSLGLIASLLLALSPWHLQYSRAGFEVTMLLTFLIFGLYFFFKSLREKSNTLWISIALLTFTPWIYSTAKLFTPILLIFLFFVWKKDILKLTRSYLVTAITVGLIIGLPITFSTVFGKGGERASYVSVFTDPGIEQEVGSARTTDLAISGNQKEGVSPQITSRLFHNKFVFWTNKISQNYLTAFSTEFLFIKGDPGLRHSPNGVGQFFGVEVVGLILGLILFFAGKWDLKIKFLVCFWVLVGALPSALTRDGGNHATRLILILPPLAFLISYGLVGVSDILKGKVRNLFYILYTTFYILTITFYLHNYYVHYPWDSERWWHAGFKESVDAIRQVEKGYDKVIISMAGEPAWIFFGGLYEYPPRDWQLNFPVDNKVNLENFGEVSHIGKYYFTALPEKVGIYGLDKIIDDKTLYLSVAKEIGANLILEPGRTPPGLKLIKAISYPSGEPAYYLFAKN